MLLGTDNKYHLLEWFNDVEDVVLPEDFKGENQVLSTFQPNMQSQIGLFPKVWKFLFPLTICLD